MPPKKKMRKEDPKQKRVDEMLRPNTSSTEERATTEHDIDVPMGVENPDFPVDFKTFYWNTNIKDIVVEEIKYHKPDTYKTYLDETRMVKMAAKFYKRYYTLMTHRLSKPLNELTIVEECPQETRERIASFPYNETQKNALRHKESVKIVDDTHPIESRIQRFPVTLKTFKKSTHWREIVDVILKYYTEEDEAKLEACRQNDEMCEKIIRNYYYNFYARSKIRTQFHIRLKPLPSHIKDAILYAPTVHELKGGEKQSDEKARRSRGPIDDTDGETTCGPSMEVTSAETTKQKVRRSKEATSGTGRKSLQSDPSEKAERKARRSTEIIAASGSRRRNSLGDVTSGNSNGNQSKDNEKHAGHISSESTHLHEGTLRKQEESVKIVEDTVPSESDIKKFPVSLKLFKMATFWREVVDAILKHYTGDDAAKLTACRGDTEMCERILLNYYYNFYVYPKVREQFQIRLKPLPSYIKETILSIPKMELEVAPTPQEAPDDDVAMEEHNSEENNNSNESNRVSLTSENTTPYLTENGPQADQLSKSSGHHHVHIQRVEVLPPVPILFADTQRPVEENNTADPQCTTQSPQRSTTEICSGQQMSDANGYEEPVFTNNEEAADQQGDYIVLDKSLIMKWESEENKNIDDCPEIWDSIVTIEKPPESAQEWPYLFKMKESKETNPPAVSETNNSPIFKSPESQEHEKSLKIPIKLKLPFARKPQKIPLAPHQNAEVVCDDAIQRNTQNILIAERTPTPLTNNSNGTAQTMTTTTPRRSLKRKSVSNGRNAKSGNVSSSTIQLDEAIKEAANFLARTSSAANETTTNGIAVSQDVLGYETDSPCLSNHTDTALNTTEGTPAELLVQVDCGVEQLFVTLPNTQQQIEALSTEHVATQDPLTRSFIDVDGKRFLLEHAAPCPVASPVTVLCNDTVKEIKQEKEMLKNVKFIYDESNDAFECLAIRESEQIVSILDESSSDINLTAELMKMPSALNSL